MKYDYLIVGSGLFGAVFAHEVTKKGKRCLVIEKREHPGGNIYTERIEDINVHKYGAHIFHTNDEDIWKYVNQFTRFNNYINSPIAIYKGKAFNLPFNMNTFYQLWGSISPIEAQRIIQEQSKILQGKKPENLEEQAISLVGTDVYETLIKGYTEKQWGKNCADLPPFIIKRLPVRFTYDNNYFNDKYQGIPVDGYNSIIKGLLKNIDIRLNTDYFKNKSELDLLADKVVYTGPIDKYFNYKVGKLEYRSLRFENEVLNIENFQGNAVVNYTDKEIPYTRILEHKHFEFGKQKKTVITKEYSQTWDVSKEPYYPVNDKSNNTRYNEYKKLTEIEQDVIFGGRLAEYKYYDMHQVIASALKKVQYELQD